MYKRRMWIFVGLIGAVFLVVVAWLGHLQLVAGTAYRREAAAALRSVKLLFTSRGEIRDRKGRILALDKPCFELCLDYRFLTGDRGYVLDRQRRIERERGVSMRRAEEIYRAREEATWRLASQIGGVSREELAEKAQTIVRRVRRIRRIVGTAVREEYQAHPVLTGLDEQDAAKLKARLGEMVGAEVRPGHVRTYPYGELACHVIGHTNEVNAEDLERNGRATHSPGDKLREYLAGDRIGRAGIEKSCEAVLRGRRGYRKLKRTVSGRKVVEERPARPGGNVRLTLDIALQRRLTDLFRELTAQRNAATGSWRGGRPSTGAVAVVRITTGEVLALVSLPVYDLNAYRRLLPDLVRDRDDLPLLHRAVKRRYPVGSTAKPITALAGLETQLARPITPRTQFTCNGRMRVGNTYLHCWTHSRGMPGHGPVDVVDGIKHSCNVYFYSVGQRVGLEVLSRWFARFGFARPAAPALPGARPGHVPTRRWLAEHKPGYRVARPFDACQVAIGQGFLGGTPLHVASAMATIARGGMVTTPRVVAEGAAFDRREEDLGISATHIEAVREGMYKVVNERGGTAYKAFHVSGTPIPDVEVYGKTGTATASPPDLDGDGRIDDLERRLTEMSWFSGFAVARGGGSVTGRDGVAVAVVVEYTTGGGSRN
ncbi:MAG: penicillin-binding transpeptidase domain-containing protein, partial [Planctomycetota bacterium]